MHVVSLPFVQPVMAFCWLDDETVQTDEAVQIEAVDGTDLEEVAVVWEEANPYNKIKTNILSQSVYTREHSATSYQQLETKIFN